MKESYLAVKGIKEKNYKGSEPENILRDIGQKEMELLEARKRSSFTARFRISS